MDREKKWLIRLVSVVWALNLGLGMIAPLHYKPSQAVNGIFSIIVSAVFIADKVVQRASKKDDEDEEAK